MKNIKIYRYGYTGYTKYIEQYAHKNGYTFEEVTTRGGADYIIIDDDSLRNKVKREGNNIINIKDMMVKFSNNNVVSDSELKSIIDQCFSMDSDTMKLGASLLLNLSFAKYGDIIHFVNWQKYNIYRYVNNKHLPLIRLLEVISSSDENLSDITEVSIIEYVYSSKLINRDIFMLFANHLLNRSKNSNNIRISLSNGPD